MRAGRVAVAVLLAGSFAGEGSGEEGDPRLTAFREACAAAPRDYRGTVAAVEAAGWQKAEEAAHPELAAMMGIMRSQMVADPQDDVEMRLRGPDIYSRAVGEGTAYVVTLQLGYGEFTMASCYLYDFDAVGGIAEAALSGWLGEEPIERIDQPGTIVSQVWQNAANLPAVEVRSNFIAEGGAGAGMTGFSGINLSVSGFVADEEEAWK